MTITGCFSNTQSSMTDPMKQYDKRMIYENHNTYWNV